MNRIVRIDIRNFKSLLDTKIVFSEKCPVTCLVGLNSSGKSSLIQAIDFISQLMRGDMDDWLQDRSWKKRDLISRLSFYQKTTVEIKVKCLLESRYLTWDLSYNADLAKCTKETIDISDDSGRSNGKKLFQLNDGRYQLNDDGKDTEKAIDFEYQGSLLSQIKGVKLSQPLAAFKNFIASIYSFDMLSPRHIRGRSKKSDIIGRSGEYLAGYLFNLSDNDKSKIAGDIQEIFPWVANFKIEGAQFGWKGLCIAEDVGQHQHPVTKVSGKYNFLRSAQHTSDGILRLIALLGALYSDHGMLLFDEIENGLNPHIIKRIVDRLLQADKQLVITTHSPEILQYFSDETALEALKITVRNEDASTRVENFIDVEEAKELLEVLSPGEVFLELELDKLVRKNEPA